jgi:hypothetical protein
MDNLDAWINAYSKIVRRHGLDAMHLLPQIHHETLAALPEVTALGAFIDDRLVSGHVWIRAGQWVRPHLAASSQVGLAVGAAYAVNEFALRHFGDCELINFGGTPGALGVPLDPAADGLIRFKRGFCNAVAPSYIAGAVLNPKAYDALCARAQESTAGTFFPAYRRADGLQPTGIFRGR